MSVFAEGMRGEGQPADVQRFNEEGFWIVRMELSSDQCELMREGGLGLPVVQSTVSIERCSDDLCLQVFHFKPASLYLLVLC